MKIEYFVTKYSIKIFFVLLLTTITTAVFAQTPGKEVKLTPAEKKQLNRNEVEVREYTGS